MDHRSTQILRLLPVQCLELSDGIVIKRGCVETRIRGKGAAQAIQTIFSACGAHPTIENILELFSPSDRPEIAHLIQQLIARRFLVPQDYTESFSAEREKPIDIFYWHFNTTALQVCERLNELSLAIVGVNYLTRRIATSLNESGITNYAIIDYPPLRNLRFFENDRVSETHWPHSLRMPLKWQKDIQPHSYRCLIATSDSGGSEPLRYWNDVCLATSTPFLPVYLNNLVGYVGPLVAPYETACFTCLQSRQDSHRENRSAHQRIDASAFEGQHILGFHPSMPSIVGEFTVMELLKCYGGAFPMFKFGNMTEINLLAGTATSRRVLKLPRCTSCTSLHHQPSTTGDKNLFAPIKELSK